MSASGGIAVAIFGRTGHPDQAIGHARERRHDDDGRPRAVKLRLPPDDGRDTADGVGIGDRRAAELHDDAAHGTPRASTRT